MTKIKSAKHTLAQINAMQQSKDASGVLGMTCKYALETSGERDAAPAG